MHVNSALHVGGLIFTFFFPTVSSKHLFKNDHTKHPCPCWDNHSATKVFCQVPQRTCCLKYLHQFSEICSLVIYPFIDENRDIFTYNTITLCWTRKTVPLNELSFSFRLSFGLLSPTSQSNFIMIHRIYSIILSYWSSHKACVCVLKVRNCFITLQKKKKLQWRTAQGLFHEWS